MLDLLLNRKSTSKRIVESEGLRRVRERQELAHQYSLKIREAMRAQGFNPDHFDDIPTAEIIAAILLGVK